MPSFTNADGLAIAYDDTGPAGARPLLMIHGFSSNRGEGWKRTGWFAACQQRGQRALALDLRGHGESAKPHDPSLYGRQKLAGDVIALMDHLEIDTADVIGFSLGSRVAATVAMNAPRRVSNLILSGVGDRWFKPSQDDDAMARAMEAGDPASISQPLLQSFRHFADEQGEDRLALAACTRAEKDPITADHLYGIMAPTLVIAGARDDLAGDPRGLAEAIPGAKAVSVPGCDHFALITHGLLKASAFDFLDGWLEEMP